MNQLIKTNYVDFSVLVESNSNISINFKSKILKCLTETFTNEEQKWYIANLYVYLNFHQTKDFPINLEDVFKLIGFAHKKNAKRTLENNFNLNEDYKEVLLPREQNSKGGRPEEQIMLNVDTFKNLCMMAKTEKGKEIRKYYVKLESIFNGIVDEEKKEYEKQLEAKQVELQHQQKLLEEKDRTIQELKKQEMSSMIYIGNNPVIDNLYKIGITDDALIRQESHRSSNPEFKFLFTFETQNAKLIESLVKLLLKPFKVVKPEWYKINYTQMKKVVDFCIMMYEDYHVQDNVDNLCEFISRYKSNRLINTSKSRVIINRSVYEEYVTENTVKGDGLRVSTGMICEDFYEWYKRKHPENEYTHIKLETGNWSTEFVKEMTKHVSGITELEYTHVSLSDKKRGIYFTKCSGFKGIELKSMQRKAEYFDESVYKEYLQKFVTVSNNPRHKVARIEILQDFLKWVKDNNFTCKSKLYCRTNVSSTFKDVFIENVSKLTGLEIQDVCKLTYSGCFVGMTHTNFPFSGNETSPRELLKDKDYIKKQVDSWNLEENTSNIARLFRALRDNNGKLSNEKVKVIMKEINVTLNKKKTKWFLVFDKDETDHFLTEACRAYIEM